jgi:hypothetical protein
LHTLKRTLKDDQVLPGAYVFAMVDAALSSSRQSQKSTFTHDTTRFQTPSGVFS